MRNRPQVIATCFQSPVNAGGSKFVRVGYRIYPTDNPARYLAAVRRNNPKRIFEHLYECDANGNKLTYK